MCEDELNFNNQCHDLISIHVSPYWCNLLKSDPSNGKFVVTLECTSILQNIITDNWLIWKHVNNVVDNYGHTVMKTGVNYCGGNIDQPCCTPVDQCLLTNIPVYYWVIK